MGHKALSKVQLGQEATPGIAVPADFVWRGPFAGLADARTTEMVDEQIGVALPSSRSYAAQLMAEWSQPVTPLTPQQAPHIFEAGIKAVGAGVADGDSSGFLYRYPFGTTAINQIATYTIEAGDETQAEKAEYCFVRSFTITANRGEVLQISSEWAGRFVENAAFTAGVTAPAVSHIHASQGQVFIDNNDGAFGDSQLAPGNVLSMTLNVTTGWTALFTVDSGQLYFHGHYFNIDEFEASLEMTFVYDTAAIAERELWRANEPRLVRVQFLGEAYATPGTTGEFTTNAFRVDFPGAWESFNAVEHDEGLSIVNATLRGGYDNESAEGLELWVANELATLP